MSALPMTVLGGYLGAGKTTFLNRVLADPGGERLAVLVNDFGDINIDAALIANQSGRTTALTNGCACCSINGDLFDAVDEILSSGEAYDRLVIEASGVADPAKLIQIALAEPDLTPAGVLVLVDAVNLDVLLANRVLADSVVRQIQAADRLVVSKADLVSVEQSDRVIDLLADMARGCEIVVSNPSASTATLLPGDTDVRQPASGGHPAYASWSYSGAAVLSEDDWRATCRDRGILRMKGFLNTPAGGRIEVHLTGDHWAATPADQPGPTELVAIGLAGEFDAEGLQNRLVGEVILSDAPVSC